MRPSLAVLLALAGCSAPAPTARRPVAIAPPDAAIDRPAELPPPDPDTARIDLDWSTTPMATDADAIAAWRKILPVGKDWELRVAQIPEDKLVPLAGALLRGGNFTCAPLVGGSCNPGALGFPDPAPDATFDEPCLRRAAALWALSALDADAVAALIPALTAIAGSPQSDDELVDSVLVAAGDLPESTRLVLLAAGAKAGHDAAVDSELGNLSEASLTTAATDLHIDGAVDALDVSLARPVFLAATKDRELRPATRAAAINDLATEVGDGKLPRDLEKALVVAAKDPDCTVAAAAATSLDKLGRHDAMPRRPRTRRVEDAMRALCVMAAGDSVEPAAAFIGPAGLKVIERTFDPSLVGETDEDRDGDHDPRTEQKVETIARGDLVAIPFDDELPIVMAHCKTATTCALPHLGIDFTFAFVPARDGGLWLDAIERHDLGECDPVEKSP